MNLPMTAQPVIIAKPSARPTRSTNLAIGSLATPPTILDTIDVVPTKGRRANEEVT